MKNILRLMDIIRVLVRYEILDILSEFRILPSNIVFVLSGFYFRKSKKSREERIRLALQDLGPTFIKFGQLLSTRVDLVGENLAQELCKLQDRVEASIRDNIYNILEQEFKQNVKTLFNSFDSTPVASASIAEVFRARTLDNHSVAVKVLRPGIERIFERDISLFIKLACFISKRNPKLDRLKLLDIIDVFKKTVKMEMDLRLEAAAASELKENSIENFIHIPKVYWKYVSKKVLTLEWVEGISIYNKAELEKKKIDLKIIGRNLIQMFLNQAYRDGFFHADLHPGNILVKNNGDIILLDFGIMGRLDNRTKVYLAEILKGFIERDYMYVADVHRRAGYISPSVSLREFAQACRSIGEPIVGVAAKDISVAKLLTHLFKVTEDFNMEVQPQLVLIQKTTVMIEGLISILDHRINMWEEAESWIKEWADKNMKFDSRMMMRIEEIKDSIDARINSLSKEGKIIVCKCTRSVHYYIIFLLIIIIFIMLYKCY